MSSVMNISYRPHTPEMAPWRVKWFNDPETNRFLVIKHTTLGKEQDWFRQYEIDATKRFFTIMADDQPIGIVGIKHINLKTLSAAVFIMIGEAAYRGQGLGKAAMQYVQNYAVNDLGLKSLRLYVYRKNVAAIRTYSAVGFVESDQEAAKDPVLMVWSSNGQES